MGGGRAGSRGASPGGETASLKQMENRAIARLLYETADLMEIAGEDSFRIRSYRNAAGVIEGHPEQICAILKDLERKITEIPGIGKGIAAVLVDIEQRGSFERRDQLLEIYPPTALEFLKIQGLGPKSIRTYCGSISAYRPSMISSASAVSRGSANCRGWAQSWKRKYCALSLPIASERAVFCSVSRRE